MLFLPEEGHFHLSITFQYFRFKAYHEKGKILHELGRSREAAVALMICVVINKEDAKVTELLNNVSGHHIT